jgi:hypothetical protein
VGHAKVTGGKDLLVGGSLLPVFDAKGEVYAIDAYRQAVERGTLVHSYYFLGWEF